MMIGNDVRGALADAKRLDLERQEEAFVVAAEAIGQRIERRPDADARAGSRRPKAWLLIPLAG